MLSAVPGKEPGSALTAQVVHHLSNCSAHVKHVMSTIFVFFFFFIKFKSSLDVFRPTENSANVGLS